MPSKASFFVGSVALFVRRSVHRVRFRSDNNENVCTKLFFEIIMCTLWAHVPRKWTHQATVININHLNNRHFLCFRRFGSFERVQPFFVSSLPNGSFVQSSFSRALVNPLANPSTSGLCVATLPNIAFAMKWKQKEMPLGGLLPSFFIWISESSDWWKRNFIRSDRVYDFFFD